MVDDDGSARRPPASAAAHRRHPGPLTAPVDAEPGATGTAGAVGRATSALARVVARKPGGQTRAGQDAMCAAVASAFATGTHLLVEAPTGTGKSLAYLIPAVLHATRSVDRRPVMVVTATKALQEQLIADDLPFVAGALADDDIAFSYAMLKGRSNYLCRAKLKVSLVEGVEARLDFDTGRPVDVTAEVTKVATWADETVTGDRAEAPDGVSDAAWSQVSVDPGECPGAMNCDEGQRCFAEGARERAAKADIVVVNTHLYASHLAAGGTVLPEHDAVVFDEAHTLESTTSSVFGMRLAGSRIRRLATRLRGADGDAKTREALSGAADAVEAALDHAVGADAVRVRGTEGALAEALARLATAAADAASQLRQAEPADEAARAKVAQTARLVDGLRTDVNRLLDPQVYANHVAWVEAARDQAELRLAAVDVGPLLAATLYPQATVVATSATLATAGRFELLARQLGLTLPAPPPDDQDGDGDDGEDDAEPAQPTPPRFEAMAVPSPFDHRRQALLYVPKHLPDPRHADFPAAMHDELHLLIEAAGGRTLALFTSRAAMSRAADALADRGDYEVLVQDRLPRSQLLERFRSGPGSALFATQSFWSGIDLPGQLCHLVTVDRLPFPRPNDPLAQARREAATARRQNSFAAVDLPVAATQLAQGLGRLIRRDSDEGVVAVFDRRLAVAGYRRTLLDTLPPFRRTVTRDEVVARLRALASAPG